jgi:hypothetical protein
MTLNHYHPHRVLPVGDSTAQTRRHENLQADRIPAYQLAAICAEWALMFILRYIGVQLGIGKSFFVAESTDRKIKEVLNRLKKEGDPGLVAMVRFVFDGHKVY